MKSEMAGKTRHLKQKFLLSVRAEPAKKLKPLCVRCAPVFPLGRNVMSVGPGVRQDTGGLPASLRRRLLATDLEAVALYFPRC
jgi:hypothetical protein